MNCAEEVREKVDDGKYERKEKIQSRVERRVKPRLVLLLLTFSAY